MSTLTNSTTEAALGQVPYDQPNEQQTWAQLEAEVRRWQVLVGHAYVFKVGGTYVDREGQRRTWVRYYVLNPYEVVQEKDAAGVTHTYLLQKNGRPRRKMPPGSVEKLT